LSNIFIDFVFEVWYKGSCGLTPAMLL